MIPIPLALKNKIEVALEYVLNRRFEIPYIMCAPIPSKKIQQSICNFWLIHWPEKFIKKKFKFVNLFEITISFHFYINFRNCYFLPFWLLFPSIYHLSEIKGVEGNSNFIIAISFHSTELLYPSISYKNGLRESDDEYSLILLRTKTHTSYLTYICKLN